MADLLVTQTILPVGTWTGAQDICALSYEDRFFRRRKLTTQSGVAFVADFAQTVSLNHGDALKLDETCLVEIVAAPEALLEITSGETGGLTRLAWHVGNRHMPCQIEPERLLIQPDHVIRDMLIKLGATLRDITEPFTPEGGAYGHGRTHSHAH